MTTWPSRLAFACACTALGLPLSANRSVVPPVAALTMRAGQAQSDSATSQMRRALKDAATAQEEFYTTHKTYATSAAALARIIAPPPKVTLVILHADARGWTGAARHSGLPGRSCVIFIGQASTIPELPATEHEHRKPGGEGVVACDAP